MILSVAMSFLIDPELLTAIDSASKQYLVKPRYLYQIGLVESRLNVDVAPRSNTNGTTDYGPFQINSVNKRNLCKDLQVETLQGNVDCAARLINRHKAHIDTDKCWLARYHSKTKRLKRKYCEKLKTRVGLASVLERINHDIN